MKRPKLTSKVKDDEILYLDELSKDKVWIPKSKLIQYIKSTYLVTPEIYYIEVMKSRGIDNFDKCVNCGRKTRWVGIFSGYTETCCTSCRNSVVSRGNPKIVTVTTNGKITHVVNQESLTKYKVPEEVQRRIPKDITLIELVEFLTSNGCTWISGYNSKSICYSNERYKNMKLANSL